MTDDQPLSVRYRQKIAAARQRKTDAAAAEAREYKAAEKDGLHTKALKDAVALWRDEASKTSSYLLHFRQYCREFGVDAQGDLLDAPAKVASVSAPVLRRSARGRRSSSGDDRPAA